MEKIGITERGDAALDLSWQYWTRVEGAAVLITKDPKKLAKILAAEKHLPNIIVHATITGYGRLVLEPNVPVPIDALEGYQKLQSLLGEERVVLRIDPIIPSQRGREQVGMLLALTNVVNIDIGRVRVSFMDAYKHVEERFGKVGLTFPWFGLHAPLKDRQEALKALAVNLKRPAKEIEICGEPSMKCTGCISITDCRILGVYPGIGVSGQRDTCLCLNNKQELLKNRGQCAHGCLYCYWK